MSLVLVVAVVELCPAASTGESGSRLDELRRLLYGWARAGRCRLRRGGCVPWGRAGGLAAGGLNDDGYSSTVPKGMDEWK
jgi:hypothetical protein